MAVISPVAGRLSDRWGSRGLATFGMGLLAAGLLAMSFLRTDSPPAGTVVGLLIVGSGMAFFQTPNTAAVLRATPRRRVGVGSALVAEMRNVGMAIGIAVTAAVLGAAVGGELPPGIGAVSEPVAAQFVNGMSVALRVGAAAAAMGAVLSWEREEHAEVEGA
jgi:MFS family permease